MELNYFATWKDNNTQRPSLSNGCRKTNQFT